MGVDQPGGHQPSEDEMRRAENMLTPEQKELSEKRAEIVEKLSDALDEIKESRFRDPRIEDIDKQCMGRFGLDFKQTRERVFSDLDSMLKWNNNLHWGNLDFGSGNWMTNKLMNVWMLKRITQLSQREVPENFHEFGGKEDMSRRFDAMAKPDSSDSERILSTHELFYVAPILLPEKVEEVLQSHGVTNPDENDDEKRVSAWQ